MIDWQTQYQKLTIWVWYVPSIYGNIGDGFITGLHWCSLYTISRSRSRLADIRHWISVLPRGHEAELGKVLGDLVAQLIAQLQRPEAWYAALASWSNALTQDEKSPGRLLGRPSFNNDFDSKFGKPWGYPLVHGKSQATFCHFKMFIRFFACGWTIPNTCRKLSKYLVMQKKHSPTCHVRLPEASIDWQNKNMAVGFVGRLGLPSLCLEFPFIIYTIIIYIYMYVVYLV